MISWYVGSVARSPVPCSQARCRLSASAASVRAASSVPVSTHPARTRAAAPSARTARTAPPHPRAHTRTCSRHNHVRHPPPPASCPVQGGRGEPAVAVARAEGPDGGPGLLVRSPPRPAGAGLDVLRDRVGRGPLLRGRGGQVLRSGADCRRPPSFTAPGAASALFSTSTGLRLSTSTGLRRTSSRLRPVHPPRPEVDSPAPRGGAPLAPRPQPVTPAGSPPAPDTSAAGPPCRSAAAAPPPSGPPPRTSAGAHPLA